MIQALRTLEVRGSLADPRLNISSASHILPCLHNADNHCLSLRRTTHGGQLDGCVFMYTFNGTYYFETSLWPCLLHAPRQGTGISIHGTVGQTPPDGTTSVTTYMLDGSTPFNVTAPVTPGPIYGYAFYTSPALEDGVHTLTVSTAAVDVPTTFWFDYLEYTPSLSGTSVAGAGSSSVSFASTSASTIPMSTMMAPTKTPDASPTRMGTSHPIRASTILLATLIPLLVLLLLLIGLVIWLRRRRRYARINRVRLEAAIILGDEDNPDVVGGDGMSFSLLM